MCDKFITPQNLKIHVLHDKQPTPRFVVFLIYNRITVNVCILQQILCIIYHVLVSGPTALTPSYLACRWGSYTCS